MMSRLKGSFSRSLSHRDTITGHPSLLSPAARNHTLPFNVDSSEGSLIFKSIDQILSGPRFGVI